MVVGLLLAACQPSSEQDKQLSRLTLTGSSTVAPLAAEIAKRFEAGNPGVRIDVQTGGSSRGVADARRGTADIGMASRALKASETGVKSFTIARDGICMIVNSANPIPTLTADQVTAVFRGEVENWKDLGGRDAPITVVSKAQGRSTLELFLQHFGLEADEVKSDVVIGDNEQGIKTVAGNPYAVGYVSVGAAAFAESEGVRIRALSLDGIAANMSTLANGSFPLNRPLNLLTRQKPEGLTRRFIDYARSNAVHDLVTDLYFVPAQ